MLVYPKEKILFIHIPKNGGAVFLNYGKINKKQWGVYQKTHTQINTEIYKKYKNWNIVTIVRNTYERLVSLYRFRCMIKKSESFKTFEDFVLKFAHKELLFNQLDYISIDDKIVANKIIIYDKNGLTTQIAKVFGDTKFKLPLKNKLTHFYGKYDWKSYYTPKALEEVNKYCKKEIEYFKFKE